MADKFDKWLEELQGEKLEAFLKCWNEAEDAVDARAKREEEQRREREEKEANEVVWGETRYFNRKQ